jgi:hypothetical protein
VSAHPPDSDRPETGLDPTSDAAFVAWLRGIFGSDGTLHVPRLVIVDQWGQECIVLQRDGYRAEVVVGIPVPEGQDRTEINVFAENGQPDEPDAYPVLGFEITVGGNDAYSVEAELDQWGGWRLRESADDPGTVNFRPR